MVGKGLLDSLDNLKQLLIWCKAQGIVSIKVGDLEVVYGPESKLPKEAQGLVDRYFKSLSDPKSDEMSLDNELLFASVK